MAIQSARWIYEEDELGNPLTPTQVAVTDDSLSNEYTMQYPAQDAGTHRHRELDEWVAVPNVITPADQYHGQTDEQIKEAKYNDNAAYHASLVDEAEHQPTTDPVLDDRTTTKERDRRDNKAKNNKISDQDDELFDHIDTLNDDLDTADDTVEAIADRATLEAWDPSMASWTPWVPPAP